MQWVISLDQLDDFAMECWKEIGNTNVLLFHGLMGAGKTTTIAALCRAKGVQETVSSPTFSIINQYQYKEHGVLKKLFHIDLYRLKSEQEAIQAGVEDAVYSGALCLVEWPEVAPNMFDLNAVHIVIEPVSGSQRAIKILPAADFHQAASSPTP